MKNKKRWYSKKASEHIFDFFNVLTLLLFTFLCFYPFWYVIIYSFSDPRAAAVGLTLLPRGFTLDNLSEVFRLPGLAWATVISILRTVIGSVITVYISAWFGYMMTKEKLPFRKIIYRFTIITMYVGAGLIPWFLTMRLYGLSNSFLVYIVPSAIGVFYVILFKTFIEQIPPALEESARMDGAGFMTCFIKIIVPLSAPIIATIFVFSAVGQWNSFFDNFIFITDERLDTLQYILFKYTRKSEFITRDINTIRLLVTGQKSIITPMTVKMTVTMVVTLPILFVYPFAQRYFVKGIMIGAIKG